MLWLRGDLDRPKYRRWAWMDRLPSINENTRATNGIDFRDRQRLAGNLVIHQIDVAMGPTGIRIKLTSCEPADEIDDVMLIPANPELSHKPRHFGKRGRCRIAGGVSCFGHRHLMGQDFRYESSSRRLCLQEP